MKSLWYRLKYSIQADLHDLFDEKESKNPVKMLNVYLKEAKKQTEMVGKLLERQKKIKHELEKELQEAQFMVEKRRKQLELAKEIEEQDLISYAQHEVTTYENRVQFVKESLGEAIDELVNLESKFETMKHKIKDMKIRQLSLMGKENILRANHKMEKAFSSENNEFKMPTFREVEQYIQNLGKKIHHEEEVSSIEDRLDALEVNAEKESKVV